jgi:hypothetical protein
MLVATFLTFAVASPWLAGGYWFATDWPGPRRVPFPTEVSSSYLLRVALALAGQVIGGEATGKLFVIAVLIVAALTAFRAAPVDGFTGRAVGATVYVLNPFVYGRLHYGQLFLLAGFAILPIIATTLRRLLLAPSPKTCSMAAATYIGLGILSIHLLMIATVLAIAVALLHVAWANHKRAYLRHTGPYVLLSAAVALVASAYWIVPILTGRGPEGTLIAGIGPADQTTFAAVPDRALGLIPNLLGLYGFWAEDTGRFTSLKAFVPYWPAILGALLVIAAIGAVAAIRERRPQLSPWVAGLLVAGLIGLVLEMGVSDPITTGVVKWLDDNVILYRGFRDAGKWAALLALVYSHLVGLGAAAIVGWLRELKSGPSRTEWVVGTASALLLALPLYFGNGLLFGMHGEIKASRYPSGWYAADQALLADKHPGRTLFLPWHEYMSYSFVQNQNSVLACPAPTFFSTRVVNSTDPELPAAALPTDPDQLAVAELVRSGAQGRWAAVLAVRHIKYVLLAREVNWKSYEYLSHQPNLTLVGDYGSIVLYRNELVT